jgi:hypothetical protein
MKNARWAIMAIGVCALGTARAWAEGLAGLDAQLNGTGRIGTFTPHAAQIAPASPDAGAPAGTAGGARDALPAMARVNGNSDDNDARSAQPTDGGAEVRPTDDAVASCRIEIARRRQVPPAKVAAESVVVRFTIERSGRVRNAEALSATGTDLEVAACAKRVLSEWVFAKRVKDRTVVERTYRFGR